jgi:serine/threonine protein kinase
MVVDNRYRVEYLIGSGGMADVWLAEDLELPRRVALKVLHERYARDPEFIARFRREAESAAALTHVNIVSIYDRGQVGDTYYIAMAYLDGRTLRDLISLGLTPQESVAIVRSPRSPTSASPGPGSRRSPKRVRSWARSITSRRSRLRDTKSARSPISTRSA